MESGDGTGKIEGASSGDSKVEGTVTGDKIEGIGSGDFFCFAGECTVKVIYVGTKLSEEIKIKILPIESEKPENPGDGGQVVNPVDPKEPGKGEGSDETPETPLGKIIIVQLVILKT